MIQGLGFRNYGYGFWIGVWSLRSGVDGLELRV
jgi:hypothetical protein